jgi:hypothetical protein
MQKMFCFLALIPILCFAGAPEKNVPFSISLELYDSQLAPALQSFAFAEHDGYWLMIGGRTNGFHGTSAEESTFPTAFSNRYIQVVNLANKTLSKMAVSGDDRFFLQSTNMLFYQDGDQLILVGGYGSNCEPDQPDCYQTFPRLSVIDVPAMIAAVKAGDAAAAKEAIVTLEDDRFRVTGGGLNKIGQDYFMVFGQNYDNVYKGAYTGKYTEQVRRFRFSLSGGKLSVTDYHAYNDPNGGGENSQYHRRDLNVVEAVRADGSKGIAVYGGVFTPKGGGWVNPVYINGSGSNTEITVDTGFEQKTSQYEAGQVLTYDPTAKTMYTTLLGGIGFYYYNDQGELVESSLQNWLPFVSNITTLARFSDGSSLEQVQPPDQSLPGLRGANAIFAPHHSLAKIAGTSEVIDLSKIAQSGRVSLGYMIGGIFATAPQSSEFNPTYASPNIYEVFLQWQN